MIFKIQQNALVEALQALKEKSRIVARWPARLKASGKSAEALFKGTKIDATAYSRWSRGVWEPSLENVKKVEAIFKKAGV